MAWIEVHQALRDHRKVLDLAMQLDMPEPAVVGHMIYLWLWSLDNAPDGVLPESDRIIERAAGWTGERGEFIRCLVIAGLVDEENGQRTIHDWEEYTGKLIDQRKANAERQRAWRERHKDNPPTPPSPNVNITDTLPLRNAATVPNTTEPNTTQHGPAWEEDQLSLASDAAETPAPISFEKRAKTKTETPPSEKKKAVNPIWDTLVDVMGHDPSPPEKGAWGKAVRDLKEMGATLEDIRTRASILANTPNCRLSPMTLAKLWYDLDPSKPKSSQAPPTLSKTSTSKTFKTFEEIQSSAKGA